MLDEIFPSYNFSSSRKFKTKTFFESSRSTKSNLATTSIMKVIYFPIVSKGSIIPKLVEPCP